MSCAAFHPFVIEIDHGGSFVEVMQDWQGNIVAYLYAEKTRAELLMSQHELDDMYEAAECEAPYGEPRWSQINRSIAEACRRDDERSAPFQIAAE